MRLSAQDAGFLYGETASGPLQTAGIMIIKGEPGFQRVFEHYASRIHLVPRLRHRLLFVPFNLAHPRWVEDPDFDVNNHIVHVPLPEGSSMDAAIEKICELNEGVMDRNVPLWKFFVVTGVPDRTLVLQQIHHAMVDGASAVQMSTLMFDFDPAGTPPPADDNWAPAPLPSQAELIAEAMQEVSFTQNVDNLINLDENGRELLQRGMQAMGRFVAEPAITAPWNAGMVGPKRQLRWFVRDLVDLRDIRRSLGGTINDVALTIVSEGAARYLSDHHENVHGQKLRMMCPVNVRTEDQKGALGNQVSAIFPMLSAEHKPLAERYEEVCAETARIKETGEAQAMTLMQSTTPNVPPVAMLPMLLVGTPFDPTRLAAAFPPPVLPNTGYRPPNPGINFVLTNVPGVQMPQYVAGHEVIEQTAIMMIGGNMGLGVAVGSYNQKMIFSFTAEPRLLPDIDRLSSKVESVFDELLALARQRDEEALASMKTGT